MATNDNTAQDVERLLTDIISTVDGKERKITYADVAKIDTINNIGSSMSERIRNGTGKSLLKMDTGVGGEENTYTPIAYPSIELARQIGIDVDNNALYASLTDMMLDNATSDMDGETKYIRPLDQRGNWIGDSWVVNPPFQFNPNDDVRSNLSFPQFGRVFNEKINTNYPIVNFEVGTIKYNANLLDNTMFGKDTVDTDLLKRIRGGESAGVNLLKSGANLIGTVLRTTWNVVSAPANFVLGLRKFAAFETDTALFAQYFEELSQSVAVMLGLLMPYDEIKDKSLNDSVAYDNKTYDEFSSAIAVTVPSSEVPIPEITSTSISGGGSYAGMRRRLVYDSVVPNKMLNKKADFIPFLVGNDIRVSESISNSTQQNPMAATLNAAAVDAQANQDSNNNQEGSNLLDNQKAALKAKFDTFVRSLGTGDLSSVINGEGRVVLPDMWADSSFSRSVSFNFTFTSPYGHNLAVFENTYIPFLLLFCMTLPRQIGTRTYTSPFFVRVNMQGMFTIPLGIVESISIDRGDSKNSWTNEHLPKTIKCSISIKDLSPALMVAMNGGKFSSLFQGNDGLTSYLSTLGGLTIIDQMALNKRAGRFIERLLERWRGSDRTGIRKIPILGFLYNQISPIGYVQEYIRTSRGSFLGKPLVALQRYGVLDLLRGKNINANKSKENF